MKSLIAIVLVTSISIALPAQADHQRNGGRMLQAFAQVLGAVAQTTQRDRYAQQNNNGYGDSGYEQVSYEQYEAAGPVIFNLSGDWVMRGGKVNRIRHTHNGLYVAPVGRGKGVHYVEIGDNLYQDANSTGTYEFLDQDYAIWRSNNKRNQAIELFRR